MPATQSAQFFKNTAGLVLPKKKKDVRYVSSVIRLIHKSFDLVFNFGVTVLKMYVMLMNI